MDNNDKKPVSPPHSPDKLTWAKFILGTVLIFVSIYIEITYGEVPYWLVGVTTALLGLLPTDINKLK